MRNVRGKPAGRSARLIVFSLLTAALAFGAGLWGGTRPVEANHPVLVEGNCDSPVPGTTRLGADQAGTCGDYDGDGRIGTSEDTDGADRIFGTLKGALGAVNLGTTVNPTTANYNGRIIIVKSGRFPELLYIGNNSIDPNVGSPNPGNVTIEAAPGVEAVIDAVLQGDPAGNNNLRQGRPGIIVNYLPEFSGRVVTLRNLTIRNYLVGVDVNGSARVNIDNCRFENNLRSNVRVTGNADLVVTNSQIQSAGYRVGTTSSTGNGYGVEVGSAASLRIMETTIANNKGAGIINGGPGNHVVLFNVSTYFNNPNIQGAVTIAPDSNHSF